MENNVMCTLSDKIIDAAIDISLDMAGSTDSREEYIKRVESFFNGTNHSFDKTLKFYGLVNNESLRSYMKMIICMNSYIDTVYKMNNGENVSKKNKDVLNYVESSKNVKELIAKINFDQELNKIIFDILESTSLILSTTQIALRYNSLMMQNKANKVVTMVPDMLIKYIKASLDSLPEDMITAEVLNIYASQLFSTNRTDMDVEEEDVSATWNMIKDKYMESKDGVEKVGYIIGNVYSNLKLNEKYLDVQDKKIVTWLENNGVDLKIAYILFMINQAFGERIISNFTVFNSTANPKYRKYTEHKLDQQGFTKIMTKFDTYYKENE